MNEQVAVLNARVACALIRMAALQAENQDRASRGAAPAYTEAAFQAIIDEEGIGWNSVCSLLYH
jgi:opacity protein-like surface antigen